MADGLPFGSAGNYLELNREAQWTPMQQNFLSLLDFWKQTLKAISCNKEV